MVLLEFKIVKQTRTQTLNADPNGHMSNFESFSGSEGVLNKQREPFPVLVSRAAVSLAVLLPLNRRHL